MQWRWNIELLQRARIAAMQTDVIATADLYVRPNVCLSVTFGCFVQTNKDTIMRSLASGRTIILVSG